MIMYYSGTAASEAEILQVNSIDEAIAAVVRVDNSITEDSSDGNPSTGLVAGEIE